MTSLTGGSRDLVIIDGPVYKYVHDRFGRSRPKSEAIGVY